MKLSIALTVAAIVSSPLPGQGETAAGAAPSDTALARAIAIGVKYRTRESYIDKQAKDTKVQFASAMALDGISKYATLFGDFDVVASAAANAAHDMKSFTLADARRVPLSGLVYANVQLTARGYGPVARLENDWRPAGIHLVLVIDDSVIQPVSKEAALISEKAGAPTVVAAGVPVGDYSLLTGTVLQYRSGHLEQEFAFRLPTPIRSKKAKIILIRPDGKRYEDSVDLDRLRDWPR